MNEETLRYLTSWLINSSFDWASIDYSIHPDGELEIDYDELKRALKEFFKELP